jgi:hypothetical protein
VLKDRAGRFGRARYSAPSEGTGGGQEPRSPGLGIQAMRRAWRRPESRAPAGSQLPAFLLQPLEEPPGHKAPDRRDVHVTQLAFPAGHREAPAEPIVLQALLAVGFQHPANARRDGPRGVPDATAQCGISSIAAKEGVA